MLYYEAFDGPVTAAFICHFVGTYGLFYRGSEPIRSKERVMQGLGLSDSILCARFQSCERCGAKTENLFLGHFLYHRKSIQWF
jgi:hypothetical protein